jgi:PAS domain S-box-containing protein
MKKPSDGYEDKFKDLLGLGKKSLKKSYYPELQKKVDELVVANNELESKNLELQAAMEELEATNEHVIHQNEDLYNSEELLRKSQKRLALHVDGTPLGVIEWDNDFRVKEWNKSAERIFGFTRDEVIGKHAFELIVAEHLHDEIESVWEGLQRGKSTLNSINENITKDGRAIVCEWYNTALVDSDNQVIGVASMVEDITRQVNTQKEIKRERDFSTEVVENIPVIICRLTPAGVITYINPAGERIIGYKSGEILGKRWQSVFRSKSTDEKFVSLNDKFDRLTENVNNFEMVLPAKSGEQKTILWSTINRFNETSEWFEIIFLGNDITELKKTQDLIIQSEKMMTVGSLAAGMAHEINNPLGIVQQGIQLIFHRISEDIKKNKELAQNLGTSLPKLRGYLERQDIIETLNGIHEASNRAAKIIKNMLQFSRKSDSTKTNIDIHEVINNTLEFAAKDYDIAGKYDFKKIGITKIYVENLELINCFATEIEQVLLNILKNAMHAIFEVQTEGFKPEIDIQTFREKNQLVIKISNNGPKIPEEVIGHLFDPFYTTKKSGQGTGLGLSISYFIITSNHNGSIEVKNGAEAGVSFMIKLPY